MTTAQNTKPLSLRTVEVMKPGEDCVATSLPILGVHAQNRLTYATTDSFCPDRPASAASPYGIVHKWTRHTTTRLPQ